MRKVISLYLFLLLFVLGAWGVFSFISKGSSREIISKPVLLKVGLVADSHNDNQLLKKALFQIRGEGASFVIGLGDYTDIGTIAELEQARAVFTEAGLPYYLMPGDHDLWAGRDQQLKLEASSEQGEASEGAKTALDNYLAVFGQPAQVFEQKAIQFVILDNSDIYKGIDASTWQMTETALSRKTKLRFVFAHKTPFHPESEHVMGQDRHAVAIQARELVNLLEEKKVDGFFSGDMHFFAKYNSPKGSVKMTTIGAVDSDRNFQGPRFGLLTIYSDFSWEVEDFEIE